MVQRENAGVDRKDPPVAIENKMNFWVVGLKSDPIAVRVCYTPISYDPKSQCSSVVEQRFCKPPVVSSNLTSGSII